MIYIFTSYYLSITHDELPPIFDRLFPNCLIFLRLLLSSMIFWPQDRGKFSLLALPYNVNCFMTLHLFAWMMFRYPFFFKKGRLLFPNCLIFCAFFYHQWYSNRKIEESFLLCKLSYEALSFWVDDGLFFLTKGPYYLQIIWDYYRRRRK